jgi:hypothetical protein
MLNLKKISHLKRLAVGPPVPSTSGKIRIKFLSGHCLLCPTAKLEQACRSVSNLRLPARRVSKEVVLAGFKSRTTVTTEDGFTTVIRKQRGRTAEEFPSLLTITTKSHKATMIWVRSSSSLPIVAKKIRSKALFVSRFSPQVIAHDIEKSLREQLKLASLACTRLKTKFDSYSSFQVSVSEDDFPLINNASLWPSGCLIAPFYGRLSTGQIYSAVNSDLPRSSSPSAGTDAPCDPPAGSDRSVKYAHIPLEQILAPAPTNSSNGETGGSPDPNR